MDGKYFNGKIDGLTFLINMVILEQNLQPNDKWEFETEDDFLKALRFFGYSDEKAKKSLQHEMDHITKAKELGYAPVVLGINIWNHPIFGRVVGPYAKFNALRATSLIQSLHF